MSQIYRFGNAELRPGERRLLIAGVDARPGGRAFDLLVALVEHRDQVVGKNLLIERVWSSRVVEESNLSVQIAALRKLLGQGAIVTVPGRGYRFCALVAEGAALALQRGDSGTPNSLVASAAIAVRRDNLPHATAGPLFGRAAELGAVRALLGAHTVVSIVGSGGIGKSRLGLAAAVAARDQFADGVWWVDLAAIERAELLPSAVASAMGLQLAGNAPVLDALCAALGGGLRALLVLDNCEQVAQGVAHLVDAVRCHAADIRFLLTSQEPVKAPGERIFRPEALDLPTEATLAAALGSNAVALFVDRATAVEPRFALGADNWESVVDICVRLDGIPLAIELAAARVPLLGVASLRSKLDQRLRLLAGGARESSMQPRRQQTLRAALGWSWDLLSPDESSVLQRLGLFSGGFSMALAQAVVTDERIDAWLALDLLGQLVDKSLVVVDPSGPRYRLLETTRLYALEKLEASGQTRHWRHRHATAMRQLLVGACDARWAAEPGLDVGVARELDNARAAFDWSTSPDGDRALALALHAASMQLWIAAGLKAEGLERCGALSTWIDVEVPAETAAQFWLTVAMMGLYSSRLACFEAAERAALLFQQLGNARLAYDALIVRIAVAARRSEQVVATAALAEAERLVDPAWPARRRSALAFAAWVAALNARRETEAVEHAWREVALSREAGSVFDEGVALSHVGAAAIYVPGQAEAGEALLHDATALMAKAGRPNSAGHSLYSLSVALMRRGATDEALAQARRAYPMLRREGEQGLMLGLLPLLAVHGGRHEDASRATGFAAAVYARSGLPPRGFFIEAVARLQQEVPAADHVRWAALGASMKEEAVYSMVLEPTAR